MARTNHVLFGSNDLASWHAACENYSAVLKAAAGTKKPHLIEDDAWVRQKLCAEVKQHAPPFLTRQQLSRVMRWKLAKGKWRPRLQQFVDDLDESEVKDASVRAFASLGGGKLKEAIAALCTLKGVGPATATAVLSAVEPGQATFMSDEALEEVLGSRAYTVAEGVALQAACADQAATLNALEPKGQASGAERQAKMQAASGRTLDTGVAWQEASGGGGCAGCDVTVDEACPYPRWTANRVQLAIWSAVAGRKLNVKGPAVSGAASSSSAGAAASSSAAGGAGSAGSSAAAEAEAEGEGAEAAVAQPLGSPDSETAAAAPMWKESGKKRKAGEQQQQLAVQPASSSGQPPQQAQASPAKRARTGAART